MAVKRYFFLAAKITTGKTKLLSISSIIATLSIIFGNIALILSLSVLDGFDIKLHDIATKFTAHLTASSFNQKPLEDAKLVEDFLVAKYNSGTNPLQIRSVNAMIQKEALIRANSTIEGVLLRGAQDDSALRSLKPYFVEGQSEFSSTTAKEIFISDRLKNKLGVNLGSKIILLSIINDETGGIPDSKARQFIVKGIYSTGFATWDDVLVITPFSQAVEMFNLQPNQFTNLEIYLEPKNNGADKKDMDITSKKTKNIINNMAISMEKSIGYPFYFQTVYDFHRSIFSWIDLQKEPIPLVLGLISLVAALNIATALIIAVVEKTNTIGILRTLGLSSYDIWVIFAIRGLAIGITGSTIGLLASYTLCVLQNTYQFFKLNAGVHFLDSVPVSIDFNHYYLVFLLSVLLSIVASALPSLFATRITPLKAIRFK